MEVSCVVDSDVFIWSAASVQKEKKKVACTEMNERSSQNNVTAVRAKSTALKLPPSIK